MISGSRVSEKGEVWFHVLKNPGKISMPPEECTGGLNGQRLVNMCSNELHCTSQHNSLLVLIVIT